MYAVFKGLGALALAGLLAWGASGIGADWSPSLPTSAPAAPDAGTLDLGTGRCGPWKLRIDAQTPDPESGKLQIESWELGPESGSLRIFDPNAHSVIPGTEVVRSCTHPLVGTGKKLQVILEVADPDPVAEKYGVQVKTTVVVAGKRVDPGTPVTLIGVAGFISEAVQVRRVVTFPEDFPTQTQNHSFQLSRPMLLARQAVQ